MEVCASVLVDEIVGFSVGKKVDRMPVLLQVMTKVDAPGGVPEPLSAYYKQDPHQVSTIKNLLCDFPTTVMRVSDTYGS
jgi:hypothetical protein